MLRTPHAFSFKSQATVQPEPQRRRKHPSSVVPPEMSSRPTAIIELASSLEAYGHLYDLHVPLLRAATDGLLPMVTGTCHSLRFLAVQVGKGTGCLLGAFSGGIFGAIFSLAWSDASGGDVTLGLVGGALGGVVGGVLGGSVSCAAAIYSKMTDRDATMDTAWLLGFAAGGVAGGAVGGPLGATGGAMGGVAGAFWALSCGTDPHLTGVRRILENCRDSAAAALSGTPPHQDVANIFRDFRRHVRPLLDQLKRIQLICDKMASRCHAQDVALQVAASLHSAAQMEAVMARVRGAGCLFQLVSAVTEAAELVRDVDLQLKETRRRAGAFLQQLCRDEDKPAAT